MLMPISRLINMTKDIIRILWMRISMTTPSLAFIFVKMKPKTKKEFIWITKEALIETFT